MSSWLRSIEQLPASMRAQAMARLAEQRAAERDSRPRRHLATKIPKPENVSVLRLRLQLRADQITGFEEEVKFHPSRNWRLDFGHRAARLAVEIEGLTYEGGRHQRMAGFNEDCRKYMAAMLLGWRVLRVTPLMVRRGEAIDAIKKLLTKNEEGNHAGTTADGDVRGAEQERRRTGSARAVEA